MGQLIVDGFAERREQAVGLLRVEQLHERAVAADVRDQRAGEQRVFAVDEALDELRELAVLGDEPLDAVGEAAVLRIEVFLELVFDLVLDGLLVLVERFLQAADEAVAFAAEGVGAHLAADVPQGEDADLEGFDGVLVAVVALGVVDEGADDFAVVDQQLERELVRQVAVGVVGSALSVKLHSRPFNGCGHGRFPFRVSARAGSGSARVLYMCQYRGSVVYASNVSGIFSNLG